MSVFAYQSYKKLIRDLVGDKERGLTIGGLAKFAGCNRSYISQVLGGKVHLTPDQAACLSQEVFRDRLEQEFFFYLVLQNRSSSPASEKFFQKELARIRRSAERISEQIRNTEKVDEITDEHKSRYYSHWSYSAIHTLVSVETFQKLELIARRLRLDAREVEEKLNELAEMGLVKKGAGQWKHSEQNIHVDSRSSHNRSHQINWHLKALEACADESSVVYSMIFTMSRADVVALKASILSFIGKARTTVAKSRSEELYVFNLDFFRV